jgi:molybdopterin/thiamine biosynthesis adenylyltransferase/rhodanese-related sulfurtransferase
MDTLSREDVTRYARQIVLTEVGLEGQRKLKEASVLIVGAGGLGSPVALYLAAAGVGHIGIVDFDKVEKGNLHRQILFSDDSIGTYKSETAAEKLQNQNADIKVDFFTEVFNAANANEIASGFDILIDASDNFPTRYLLNDLCVLTNRPLVYGSISRFEGQVSVYIPYEGPCFRCIFPTPPPVELIDSCAVSGVLGSIPGIIGSLQASETIKLILGIGEPLKGRLLLVDALDMEFQTVQFSHNPNCEICGNHPTIHQLMDTEAFCGSTILPGNATNGLDITPLEFKTCLTSKIPLQVLDVREPGEKQISDISGAIHIRLAELAIRVYELDPNKETVVYCRSGIRSSIAVGILREAGFPQVHNLRGGINAWVDEIDPTQVHY